ncbi:MAG: ribosomal-processing cysteine protease Prp [Erysipelotrichaceae bacterium]|nr:ribosomal-processing cysteine protease Prp [Erysipelotrichaceae bacterium]
MIEITRCNDSITIKGHAGYAEHGKDIVCAGVSALAQTMISSLLQLTNDNIEYHISSGNIEIKHWNLSEAAQLLIDSFFIGVKMMADTYLNHIRIVQALQDVKR